MIKNRYCFRCNKKVKRETVKGLRERYPFYCPNCCENMFYFETYKKRRNGKKGEIDG